MAKGDHLTEKQRSFCIAYIKHFNATRAYFEAGYSVNSRMAAGVEGHKLLKNPKINAELDKLITERRERLKVESGFVLEWILGALTINLDEVARIGRRGIELKEFDSLEPDIKKYITEVNMTESKKGGIMVNFKIFSKEKAMDLLARHAGLNERTNVNVNLSFADLVEKHG